MQHTHLLAQIRNPVLDPVIGAGAASNGGTALGRILGAVMGGIMFIAFFLAFLFLVMGGIGWITAGGDKAQLETSRNKIIHAFIGLIIIASLWAVMLLIGQFLGIDFPNIPIPSVLNSGTTVNPLNTNPIHVNPNSGP